MDTNYVFALTTLPLGQDPGRFARALVEERLAACVNVLPEMISVYRWQGAVEDAREQQVVIKTTRRRLVALWERIRSLHTYELPEFIVLPIIDGDDAYLRWIEDSTDGGAP
jgi:periplasmic divalent cation tolerance protein